MTFLIISVVILNLIAILMPKHMTKNEIFTTILFALFLQKQVDLFLDLKYDLYGYFGKGPAMTSLIPVLVLYPAANVIILNYYPFTNSKFVKLSYILGWSAFLVLFEWASCKGRVLLS
jgi:hypothetical protein